MTCPQTLSTREAYERWSHSYPPAPHNPLMQAEQTAMYECWPDVAGKWALDLACGTGRYSQRLVDDRAAAVVALDLAEGMLNRVAVPWRVRAEMTRLPLRAASIDVVISGLAIGHADSLCAWMTEVSRVLRDGGVLLYSDFHPHASRAGLLRSFTDEFGQKVAVPHIAYSLEEHHKASAAAGLKIDIVRELRAGQEFVEKFPGSDEFYGQWRGLALLVIVGAHK
jgi:ubiquinone/menaquinone biosynthesis C-methylase UbiE